ncbi:MAG TPA: glycosyltransferase [Coriobacteriia bacterium]
MAVDRGALRVSIVVPTLNEAARLPVLLDCLDAQTRQPDEIIVADAASSDGTAAMALTRGARVVPGGLPGMGRNAGAAAATGDILLFMDADAVPAPAFLQRAVAEFQRRGLSVATAPMRPVENSPEYAIMCALAEGYMRGVQKISPHAVGLCILVERGLHERIGGFDESIVLAEDHDYARRAAHAGRFGVLRSVAVPTPMRRLRKEGRLHMARVMVYSEVRTLAGMPIRSIPFDYDFGVFEGDRKNPDRRSPLLLRQLSKPSTEVQSDAIGLQMASTIGGGIGTAALVAAGAGPGTYLSFASVAAAVAGLSAYEALRKLRFEKPYGEFFMASVAVASADIRDSAGRTIIRKGIDEVCELHAIGHLGRMSGLNRQGLSGRLTIVLESLEGLRAMMDDIDDPMYRSVTHVTARSDLTTILFKMGFSEIDDPPRFDAVNRAQKRALMWFIGQRIGRTRSGDVTSYRMALVSKDEFAGELLRSAVDDQIARARRGLVRARARG